MTVRGTPGQLQQIDRRIQIPIQHQPTLFTVKDPIREGQLRIDPATATTPLAGGLPPIRQDHSRPIPVGLVEQLPLELGEPHIADGLSQMMVLEHPTDIQIFDDQHGLGSRQPGRDLMQRVVPLIRDLPMELGELADGFLAVVAAFLPPTHHPLEALELLDASFEVARIGDHRPIGEGGQLLDPQVNPHDRAIVLWSGQLLFHLHGHVPVPRLLTHRGREDLYPDGRKVLALFEPQPTQPRQHDRRSRDHDGAGEPETAQSRLLGLEAGIPELSLPLPLLFEVTPSKELLEGGIQVPQRFLRRTLGDLIHPGHVRLLETVEFPVQLDGGRTRLARGIAFLLDPESPVVGPARGAGMLAAGCHLSIVEVQLRFVCPLYQHPVSLRPSPAILSSGRPSPLDCWNKCIMFCCSGQGEQTETHGHPWVHIGTFSAAIHNPLEGGLQLAPEPRSSRYPHSGS